MELEISSRLKKLLPRLSAEERKQLKANIRRAGRVLDSILFWTDPNGENVIIDGMHRYEIVQEIEDEEIPYQTRRMEFDSYEEAEIWILDHQLGRRNLLKPPEIRKLRGRLYNLLKGQRGGDRKSGKSKGQNVPLIRDASSEVAKKAGVTSKTIKRDGAREAKIESLTKAAQGACEGATDAEINALSKLNSAQQNAAARRIRVGQAKSVSAALKDMGAKAPKSKPKPSKDSEPTPKEIVKIWADTVGRWFSRSPSIDELRNEFPSGQADAVLHAAKACYETLKKWQRVLK